MQSSEQQEETSSKAHIIIVEDDAANAQMLDLLLRTEQYHVTCFRSGAETLANLDRIQQLHPALFMLDYRLPPMNALTLSEQLHTTQGLENVPTMILSGSQISEEERARMLQQHVILIAKPYDIDDLLATIEQIIR